jgi:hypothetical protein
MVAKNSTYGLVAMCQVDENSTLGCKKNQTIKIVYVQEFHVVP